MKIPQTKFCFKIFLIASLPASAPLTMSAFPTSSRDASVPDSVSTDEEGYARRDPRDLVSEDEDAIPPTGGTYRASSSRGRGRPGSGRGRGPKKRLPGHRGSSGVSPQLEAIIYETNSNTIILKNEIAAIRTDLANLSQRLTIVYSTGGQGPLTTHNRIAADNPQ